MNSRIKICVIGANSYIARNLVHNMNKDEFEIYLYDKDEYSKDNLRCYTQINILNIDDIKLIRFECDIIFYFAGITGTEQGFNNYADYIDVNEKALLNILTVYKEQNSKAKFIYPSTRLVYKGTESLLNEAAQNEFKTVYAINKYAGEQYLAMYHNMYGLKYLILRICVPYANEIDSTYSYGTIGFLINSAINNKEITVFGDGSQRRTFTHIHDLCTNMLLASLNDKCVNDVYNIGGQILSLDVAARKIAQKYNVSVKYVPWPENAKKLESGSTVFDSTKLDNLIGSQYAYNFDDWLSLLK